MVLNERMNMADESQYRILIKGVNEWNDWRSNHADIPVDLNAADLSGLQLSNANLAGAALDGVNCQGVDLRGASLKAARLNGANLSRAVMKGANFERVELKGAYAWGADFEGCVFQGAELTESDFRNSNLSHANLKETRAARADFHGVLLRAALLNRSDLSRCNFTEADLRYAALLDADLTYSNLSGTNLSGANLLGAKMFGAKFGLTILANVDLSKTTGLEGVVHAAPSAIGIDTIFLSGGVIEESFLRRAGVPDRFLEYMQSLVGRAIEYYSCFISYSSKDQPFVERLYADLQARGIRTWFAPEDLKIGEKTRTGIETAIKLHDKLLLVLSENSVLSQWVEREVETAFEKEKDGKLVLFPITLDDSFLSTDVAWAADIRRTRNVGNFKEWQAHELYSRGLERLVRDLKAVGTPVPGR